MHWHLGLGVRQLSHGWTWLSAEPYLGLLWNIYMMSPCDLGFLTTWWPQGSQTSYVVARDCKGVMQPGRQELYHLLCPSFRSHMPLMLLHSIGHQWTQAPPDSRRRNWAPCLDGEVNGNVEWETPFWLSLKNTICGLSVVFAKPLGTWTISFFASVSILSSLFLDSDSAFQPTCGVGGKKYIVVHGPQYHVIEMGTTIPYKFFWELARYSLWKRVAQTKWDLYSSSYKLIFQTWVWCPHWFSQLWLGPGLGAWPWAPNQAP